MDRPCRGMPRQGRAATDATEFPDVRLQYLDLDTGNVAFALIGDTGPRAAIGEGTVALAAALGGDTVSSTATFSDIKALKRSHVATVIFPTRDVPKLTDNHFSQADIDRLGMEALAAFGGKSRLFACAGG